MDKKYANDLKLSNSGNLINQVIKKANMFNKLTKIYSNNKLFAYQKAKGNIRLLKKLIHQNFVDKYYHDKNFYNSKVIGNIINNESTHIVAEFKDYLIYGDDSEFLQKNYNIKEIKKFLPKLIDYYKSSSVIFPNYVILHESKYIYNNIQKKQRIIDKQQEQEEKRENIKCGKIKEKEIGGEKNDNNLFNTNAINSILEQTNTSNIKKLFGINNEKKNEKKNENTESNYNNIINEIKKNEEKKNFFKKRLNLIKKKGRILSLTSNSIKGLINKIKPHSNEMENSNDHINIKNNNKSHRKKVYINNKKKIKKYSNYEEKNLNIKYFLLKNKSLIKKNEADKSNSILNVTKKVKIQKSLKEKKKFLTHENTITNIYNKIPKSKLSIDFEAIKNHQKLKTSLNEPEIINQNGISFFIDIIKHKKFSHQNSKINSSRGKSSSKTKNLINAFIPFQKLLFRRMKKDKNIYLAKSTYRNKELLTQINCSSSPFFVNSNINTKTNICKPKIPNLYIKDSNSSSNITKNNTYINSILDLSRSRSIIYGKIDKKLNTNLIENNSIENLINNKEIISESNINININTLPITDKENDNKEIYFTISPHINNMINLNKIKYMIKNESNENITNSYINEIKNLKNYKISKYTKNKINKKNNLVNNKKKFQNKNKIIIKNNKKSNNYKSSFKNSNNQISSSLVSAPCSIRKNSHLNDYETIKIYKNRKGPHPSLYKTKSINEKKIIKNNNFLEEKLSLSPVKRESKKFIKKMLLKNPINNYDNLNISINKNIINKIPIHKQNKKQNNNNLTKMNEKEIKEFKIKHMLNLILNNKDKKNNSENTSRNLKKKEKSVITLTNRVNNSININATNRNHLISIKTSKNSNFNKNQYFFPYNQTDYGNLNNNIAY